MCLLDHTFYSDSHDAEYELSLDAWGEGILSESGLLDFQRPGAILKEFKKKYRRFPKSISLLIRDPRECGYEYGFSGVESALLEKLETLKELILPDSITGIDASPALLEILKNNDTLIRGSFDSFAESFAAGHGLKFRPADCVFAEYCFERAQENTKLTLVFLRNGGVQIKEEVSEPGTSASNTFGGSFFHKLPADFYKTGTAEQIAGQFKQALCDEILRDGRLAAFIEKAKKHDYYKGKN